MNLYKTFFRALLVFIISAILITFWYILIFSSYSLSEINLKSFYNVLYRFGSVLSIPIAISYLIIDVLRQKIKTQWILILLIIVLVSVMLFVLAYVFVWYVGVSTFIDDPLE